SYTDFTLSEIIAIPHGNGLTVAVTVTNRGSRAGADVPQVYVGRAGPAGFVHRLAGFRRVMLEAGQHRRVEIPIEPRLLARFDVERRRFMVEGGRYSVRVGRHAADTSLVLDVELEAGPT
ncbi:MAG: fibronectin type III-like domain-contianing protein, partial [Pseudomonadota bacterium]|nr:fibronectin type III-like domain-contianing protein [Pseudomonadota bacterium]